MAPLQNLPPDLTRCSAKSYAAQIRRTITADSGNAVTALAAPSVEVERPALLRRTIRGANQRRRGQESGAHEQHTTGLRQPFQRRPHAESILSNNHGRTGPRAVSDCRNDASHSRLSQEHSDVSC
jgi:hypothetical protein